MYGRGFGFFVFAMLVVALIAECVVSKGSFSGIRRIVVLLILQHLGYGKLFELLELSIHILLQVL